jgi:hypothetical protein
MTTKHFDNPSDLVAHIATEKKLRDFAHKLLGDPSNVPESESDSKYGEHFWCSPDFDRTNATGSFIAVVDDGVDYQIDQSDPHKPLLAVIGWAVALGVDVRSAAEIDSGSQDAE